MYELSKKAQIIYIVKLKGNLPRVKTKFATLEQSILLDFYLLIQERIATDCQ